MTRVTVDVDLDEFDDDEILEAAAEILEHRKRRDKAPDAVMQRIASALNVPVENEDDLPPKSTAALVHSREQLVKLCGTHFRLIGDEASA